MKHLFKGTAPRIKLVSNNSAGFPECEMTNNSNFKCGFARDSNPEKVNKMFPCHGEEFEFNRYLLCLGLIYRPLNITHALHTEVRPDRFFLSLILLSFLKKKKINK